MAVTMLVQLLTRLCFVALLLSSPALACDVTLQPDGNTAAIQHAMDRPGKRPPVVCLRPGVYKGARFLAMRSATLRRLGTDKVVLDAGNMGRVLTIAADGIAITLDGITITGGKADRGGGIAVTKTATVTLRDCWLYGNTATLLGGGAIAADAGKISLVRTRVTGNRGERTSAIDLAGTVQARLVSTLVADNQATGTTDPPVRLRGQARLDLVAATVAYNSGSGIVIQPEGEGPRHLTVASSIVVGKPDALTVPRSELDHVRIDRAILYGNVGWVALDLLSQKALPGFNLKEVERYRPETGSAAIALGRCMDPDARRDLVGKPRGTTCTAGALEAPPADVKATLAQRKSAPAKKKTTDWRDL